MRSKILFLVLVTLQAVFISWFHFNFHEPWRDEVQHLLLSLAQPSFADLLTALRFEGHPPLIHLLYRALHLFCEPRLILALVSGIGYFLLCLSFFALFLSARITPGLAAIAAWLLSLSYIVTYELGVISRSYGVGLAFAIGGLAALVEGESRVRYRALGFLCLALSILTSVHSALLSLCLAVPFFVQWCLRRDRRTLVVGLIALAIPFTLLSLVVRDYPERMASPVVASVKGIGTKLFHMLQQMDDGEHVWQLIRSLNYLVFDFVFPTPWWNIEYSDVFRWVGMRLFWGLLALTVGSLFFRRHRFKQAALTAVTLTFSAVLFDFFFRYLYPSSFRHHAFYLFPLFLLMAVHWISLAHDLTPVGVVIPHARDRLRHGATLLSLMVLGLLTTLQIAASALALGSDYFWYFSQTAMAPAFIPNSPKSLVMVDSDYTGTALALWIPKAKLYSRTANGRQFTYVKWDKDRTEIKLSRKALFGRMCERVKVDPSLSLYYLAVYPSFDRRFPMKEIFASSPVVPTGALDERFRYYSVNCLATPGVVVPHHASN